MERPVTILPASPRPAKTSLTVVPVHEAGYEFAGVGDGVEPLREDWGASEALEPQLALPCLLSSQRFPRGRNCRLFETVRLPRGDHDLGFFSDQAPSYCQPDPRLAPVTIAVLPDSCCAITSPSIVALP